MDSSPTSCMEELHGPEEEEEEEGDLHGGVEEEQQQKKPAWAPCVFSRTDKEVFFYAGQEIIITEGLDSYAGMIWPGAQALCHYLDSDRQRPSLVDQAVLEIGAGTGLVSIVASLLGAWVTATDLPEYLSNLRFNLSRNTRGRCRHTPQAAGLSWSFNLEETFPASVYRYDYVLAADVVYHHDFLDELLATMKHFCRPGTRLIWANKVRMESDLVFTRRFTETFDTSLLAENGDMKIFMGTCREEEVGGQAGPEVQEHLRTEEGPEEEESRVVDGGEPGDVHLSEEKDRETHGVGEDEPASDQEEEMGGSSEEEEVEVEEVTEATCKLTTGDEHLPASGQPASPGWVPGTWMGFGRDVYRFARQDIIIYESIDSFGAVMWPAALALCSLLDDPGSPVELRGTEVLELGAGTGLVSIVASLLGASVTATDLPEVLGNLRSNLMRNTRGRCTHTPRVEALSWSFNLEKTFPASVYRYDYVLAADVVYHHDFLDELLATMKHFCRPGTRLIWANKVRMESDLVFTRRFTETFDTSLLAENGDMKIFMGTCRK